MTSNKYFIIWTITFIGALFCVLFVQALNEMYLSSLIFSAVNLTVFCAMIICWSIYACAYVKRSNTDYYVDFSLIV